MVVSAVSFLFKHRYKHSSGCTAKNIEDLWLRENTYATSQAQHDLRFCMLQLDILCILVQVNFSLNKGEGRQYDGIKVFK